MFSRCFVPRSCWRASALARAVAVTSSARSRRGLHAIYPRRRTPWAATALVTPALTSTRWSSSKSLADEIMKAKIEQEQKAKDAASESGSGGQAGGGGTGEEPKGPKPLSKWQKYGYIFFGTSMVAALVGNGIMFCKNSSL